MIKPWRTVSRRVLLDRKPWFTVGAETVELPDGRIVEDFGFIDMVDFAVIWRGTPRLRAARAA